MRARERAFDVDRRAARRLHASLQGALRTGQRKIQLPRRMTAGAQHSAAAAHFGMQGKFSAVEPQIGQVASGNAGLRDAQPRRPAIEGLQRHADLFQGQRGCLQAVEAQVE